MNKNFILPWLESTFLMETDECILWPYTKNKGYGKFTLNRKTRSAHRYVCIKFNGEPTPDKNECRHLCGNRACVNKRHIQWATRKENMSDKLIHGTHQFGENNPNFKFTTNQVKVIRNLKGVVAHEHIIKYFGISRVTINRIWRGTARRITGPAACTSR